MLLGTEDKLGKRKAIESFLHDSCDEEFFPPNVTWNIFAISNWIFKLSHLRNDLRHHGQCKVNTLRHHLVHVVIIVDLRCSLRTSQIKNLDVVDADLVLVSDGVDANPDHSVRATRGGIEFSCAN